MGDNNLFASTGPILNDLRFSPATAMKFLRFQVLQIIPSWTGISKKWTIVFTKYINEFDMIRKKERITIKTFYIFTIYVETKRYNER